MKALILKKNKKKYESVNCCFCRIEYIDDVFIFIFRNNILMMWMATLFMPKNDPYMIILNTPLIKNLI